MTTGYRIDISKNILKESKLLRISEFIYMYMFLFIGCFYIIYTFIKGTGWPNYSIGLTAFILFFIRYMQTNGKWIYKKYVYINSENISWQKTIFLKANFKWQSINQIDFQYSSIDFHLTTNEMKSFSLTIITALQITELKKILSQLSAEKGIKFIAS